MLAQRAGGRQRQQQQQQQPQQQQQHNHLGAAKQIHTMPPQQRFVSGGVPGAAASLTAAAAAAAAGGGAGGQGNRATTLALVAFFLSAFLYLSRSPHSHHHPHEHHHLHPNQPPGHGDAQDNALAPSSLTPATSSSAPEMKTASSSSSSSSSVGGAGESASSGAGFREPLEGGLEEEGNGIGSIGVRGNVVAEGAEAEVEGEGEEGLHDGEMEETGSKGRTEEGSGDAEEVEEKQDKGKEDGGESGGEEDEGGDGVASRGADFSTGSAVSDAKESEDEVESLDKRSEAGAGDPVADAAAGGGGGAVADAGAGGDGGAVADAAAGGDGGAVADEAAGGNSGAGERDGESAVAEEAQEAEEADAGEVREEAGEEPSGGKRTKDEGEAEDGKRKSEGRETDEGKAGDASEVELSPTYETIHGREVVWQMPSSTWKSAAEDVNGGAAGSAAKPRGVAFFAHGCTHKARDFWPRTSDCPLCVGLPEDKRLVRSALRWGFAVVAVSSEGTCWDVTWPAHDSEDVKLVVKVLDTWRHAHHLTHTPLVALGASSGGFFISILAHAVRLHSLAIIISAGVHQAFAHSPITTLPSSSPGSTGRTSPVPYPPTLFVHMPRDKHTAKGVEAAMATLQEKGVRTEARACRPMVITDDFLSDRIEGFPREASEGIRKLLRKGRLLSNVGMLAVDGRRSGWTEVVRPSGLLPLLPDGRMRWQDDVEEELNLAFAYHEMTSEYAEDIMSWFESSL